MADVLKTPIGAMCFPDLFTPRPPTPGADERYSVVLLLDEEAQKTTEFRALKKAAYDAAKAKWGDRTDDLIKQGKLRMPFRDAGEMEKYAGFEPGKVFIRPWSKQKPDVIDGRLNDVVPSDCYPGMLGRLTLNPFAYDNSGNRGVSFGLNNVQITSFKSPRLDGKKAGKDEFDAVDQTDENELDDDDVPF